jgi:hypothetical protein
MEPFLPGPLDPLPKLAQPQVIACDAVVGKVAPKFLAQLLVLLRNRSVPITTTPLGDALESPIQTLMGGLALDNPFPSTRLAPVVGKAQKIEGARFAPAGARRSPEGHQTSLVRMDCQPVFPKALGEYSQHPLHIRN